MTIEPITTLQIMALRRMLGSAAILVDLNRVDFTRGRVETGPNCYKMWTLDKKRINIDTVMHGEGSPALFASQTREIADDWPATPAFPDTNPYIKNCINPFCSNQVDVSKRKSGACCKACMNYECSHPDCVARAELNGWARATHPWGTKIAEAHKGWRVKP